MPPTPGRPPSSLVQDAATILSILAQIAHRAAYAQAAGAASSTASTSRPWPTQQGRALRPRPRATAPMPPFHQQQQEQQKRDDVADKTSLPPQAPDGTFTEMKHVNAQAHPSKGDLRRAAATVQSESSSSASPNTRSLDDSLAAYFGEPPEEVAKEIRKEPPIPHSTEPPPPPPGASKETVATPFAPDELSQEARRSEPASASSVEGLPSAAASSSKPPSPPSPPPPPPPSPRAQQPEEDEDDPLPAYDATTATSSTPMRASRVPSSRIARLMHYGSLGAGLAWGAAGSFLSPSAKPTPPPAGEAIPGATPSPAAASMGMSPSNVRRLVDKLSCMRGAALKLGQFLSIQDADLLPKEIEEVLRQVQSSANYMPEYQLEGVMRAELGAEWRSHFSRFDVKPFAAASIGQVHYAVLSETHPEAPGMEVAVKVQFPGIKESIESDLGYLRWLLAASALLPRGLFLDKTIQQMRMELNDECDYEREAEMGSRFGQIFNTPGQDTESTSSSSKAGTRFEVPRIIPSLCTSRVLTTQMMKGRPLSMVSHLSQPRRDALASQLLHLCLSELFTHRLMQTDPNFSNFLYEPRTRSLQLIDFGATREYGRDFMDKWLRLLLAAVGGEEEECRHWSLEVGYLLRDKESGECLESDAMVAAHVRSMILLGSPFRSKPSIAVDARYDFTTHSTLTDAIKAEIPLMLRERKTPPPKETYSLNRKLSGTFLLCSKLRAKVDCAQVLRDVVEGYRFEDGGVLRAREDGEGGWKWQVVMDAVSGGAGRSTWGSTLSASGSRGLHTSARVSRDKSGSDKGASSSYIAVADRPRGPRKWERYGVNLSDRYPRSLLPSSTASLAPDSDDDVERMDTLAAKPAGTSFLDPTAAPSPSDSSNVRENVPIPPAGRSSPAEDPRTAADDPSENKAEPEPEPKLKPSPPAQVRIAGHLVPTKPDPPGPEDCCMSGCAVCVYDLYRDALTDWQDNLDGLRETLLSLPPTEVEWNDELLGSSREEAQKRLAAKRGGGGAGAGPSEEEQQREAQRKEEEDRQREDAIIANVEDPTMRAFLEMERGMKRKEREQKAKQQQQQ